MNEVGFHAKVPSAGDLLSGQSAGAWYYSTARTESLITCLRASTEYLDYSLALSPEDFIDFTMDSLLRLMYGVLIHGRFATGCDAPCLDATQLRETSKLSYYLDSFVNKTESLLKSSQGYRYHIHKIFVGSKLWYEQMLAQLPLVGFDDCNLLKLEFMDILPSILGSCIIAPGTNLLTSFTSAVQQTCLLNVGWLDMLPDFSKKPVIRDSHMNSL